MSADSAAGFSIDPDAVRNIAGNLGGILMQAISVSRDLERLIVPPSAYAQIGTAVASGSSALQDGQVAAMRSMLQVLSDISSEVSRVSSMARADDDTVASSLTTLHSGGGSSLWGSVTAASLADTAMAGGKQPSTGSSVDGVLDQLGQTGMGQLAQHPVPHGQFHDPKALADWLDTDPDNQTRLGVIGVYAGNTGNLSDVPGGLHPGDVVYVDRWQLTGASMTPSAQASLGVVGSDGQLYNHGAINTSDWSGVTDLRVYRPIGAT